MYYTLPYFLKPLNTSFPLIAHKLNFHFRFNCSQHLCYFLHILGLFDVQHFYTLFCTLTCGFYVCVIFTLRATGVLTSSKLIKLMCLLLFRNTNAELLRVQHPLSQLKDALSFWNYLCLVCTGH